MKRKTALKVDSLIDRFVDTINRWHREPGFADEIPPSVRGESVDPPGEQHPAYDWSITPWPSVDWIEEVEERSGLILPPSYRSLVTRYIFPAFEAGPLQLSGNTPEGIELYEFRERVFADPTFVDVLLAAGYIPFANPAGGSYDPICFDTRARKRKAAECPVVWIDHEEVLCYDRIKVLKQVSPSFELFVAEFVRAYETQAPSQLIVPGRRPKRIVGSS